MQDFQSAQCTVRFDIILQRQHWIYGWNWILKSLVFRFLDTESLVFRFLDTESLVFRFLDTESLDFRSMDSESLVFHFSLYSYLDFESLIVWFLNSESLVVCSIDSESLDYRSADFESLFIRSLNSECLLGLLLYSLFLSRDSEISGPCLVGNFTTGFWKIQHLISSKKRKRKKRFCPVFVLYDSC